MTLSDRVTRPLLNISAALSDLPLATVSEHLKVQRKSGLLILSKQGRFWIYRTDTGALRTIASAVAQLEGT
jgi:DNA-binding transcriptional ArsR family regulator